ncbi:MAG: hypothetical protein QNJ54_28645 [Prochloraceae cyanobacterium]|nr:hypothetical protein [Prochloraceae cyanobacterium]
MIAVKEKILEERLRQARSSSNLALVVIALSFFVSLGLLLSGRFGEGTISTIGGLVSSLKCLQFASEANDRLDRILIEEEESK